MKIDELKSELKKKKFVTGCPVVVRFKLKNNKGYRNINATKGEYVVKWKDILKVLGELK